MKRLNGGIFLNCMREGFDLLRKFEKEVNEINFFPLPDKDTGTNLIRTFDGVFEGLREEDPLFLIVKRVSERMIMTAQGNSGIILSQFFTGLAKALKKKKQAEKEDFLKALQKGVEFAYSAVYEPREGTILTVMRAFFEGFKDIVGTRKDFVSLLENGLRTAEKALEKTKEQIDILSEKNVVDAGGLGFVLLMRGFVEKFKELQHPPRFEIHIVLRTNKKREQIFEALRTLGTSIAITSTNSLHRIHIHTNHPERVRERLSQAGEIIEENILDLHKQIEEVGR